MEFVLCLLPDDDCAPSTDLCEDSAHIRNRNVYMSERGRHNWLCAYTYTHAHIYIHTLAYICMYTYTTHIHIHKCTYLVVS